MSVILGTGFENVASAWMAGLTNGSVSFPVGNIGEGTSIGNQRKFRLTTAGPSGTPCYIRLPVPGNLTELYFTIWLDPQGTDKGIRIEVETADGTIGVRKPIGSGNIVFNMYKNEVEIVTGGGYTAGQTLMHELYIKIAASGGRLVHTMTQGDGTVIDSVNYTGNTLPGASSEVVDIKLTVEASGGDFADFDDLTVKDDAAPGDIRYYPLLANGDDTTEWSPDSGATNYTQIDERPPSDSDYVQATTNDAVDLYDFDDYPLSEAVAFVVMWHRARSQTGAEGFLSQMQSGSTVRDGTPYIVSTSFLDIQEVVEEDPDTETAWSATGVDGLRVGQKSIVSGGNFVRVSQVVLEIAYSQLVIVGESRPLGLDVDDESGLRMYVTLWANDILYLQRLSTLSMAAAAQTNFGSATEAEVDARTYFIVPFTPSLPGVSSFGNYVYIFGRWDAAGTARHIALSTNGGGTFTNIGNAAWTTERVGAFFLTTVNDLFVFLTDGTLWYSGNAGGSWTQIATMPFSVVEYQAFTRHAQGRIAIGNAQAGSVQAAWKTPPLATEPWIDATGPAGARLPTAADGGGGIVSLIWI